MMFWLLRFLTMFYIVNFSLNSSVDPWHSLAEQCGVLYLHPSPKTHGADLPFSWCSHLKCMPYDAIRKQFLSCWVSLVGHLTTPLSSFAVVTSKAQVQSCWTYLFIIQEMLILQQGFSCFIPLWKEQLLLRRQASCILRENSQAKKKQSYFTSKPCCYSEKITYLPS